MTRRVRVFLGLGEICGYYANLRYGLEELGIPSAFVAIEEHPFNYGNVTSNAVIRWAQATAKRRIAARRSALAARYWWSALDITARTILFVWAVMKFDVFIFGFGRTFFRGNDLPLLRLLGKRIICVFHGSDERPPYLNGYVMTVADGPTTEAGIKITGAMKRRIRWIERFADVIVSHPLSAHLHERRIVPALAVGVAYRMASLPCPQPPAPNGKVRILHAPSRPEAKGTMRIRRAIENLKAKGLPIELIEITNRPNAEVLDELSRCDLVVDEVWSDTPMAGFAAEAACYGKPAVVGGYGWDLLKEMVPAHRFPPSQACHPDAIEPAIEQLVVDAEFRRDLGARARRFVESQWTCRKVAETYIALLDTQERERWLCDPKGHLYLHGCGMDEHRAKETVRLFIDRGGLPALQVGDRPDWEEAFARFAGARGE